MNRADQGLERLAVPGGGTLYVKRQTFGPELGQVESTLRPNASLPPEEAGYYTFLAYAAAGEVDSQATGFNETEAAAIIGGLTRILVPSEDEARWVAQNLLPSGELPNA